MSKEKLTLEKAKMYSTAYSPLYDCFVKIDKVRVDDRGELIFNCSCEKFDLHYFRECELKRFTL